LRALLLVVPLAIPLAAGPALAGSPSDAVLRQAVGEVALAQTRAIDPRWEPTQRDCAGLFRFAWHEAFRRFDSGRLARPLWRDARGGPSSFADAETLLAGSLSPLGRDRAAREELVTGDVLAFRQAVRGAPEDWDDAPVFHLMLVVKDSDPARPTLLVYHPGSKDGAVKLGTLEEMTAEAPREWRPVPENGAFLGFFRYHAGGPR
jgi:uncharacterized protein